MQTVTIAPFDVTRLAQPEERWSDEFLRSLGDHPSFGRVWDTCSHATRLLQVIRHGITAGLCDAPDAFGLRLFAVWTVDADVHLLAGPVAAARRYLRGKIDDAALASVWERARDEIAETAAEGLDYRRQSTAALLAQCHCANPDALDAALHASHFSGVEARFAGVSGEAEARESARQRELADALRHFLGNLFTGRPRAVTPTGVHALLRLRVPGRRAQPKPPTLPAKTSRRIYCDGCSERVTLLAENNWRCLQCNTVYCPFCWEDATGGCRHLLASNAEDYWSFPEVEGYDLPVVPDDLDGVTPLQALWQRYFGRFADAAQNIFSEEGTLFVGRYDRVFEEVLGWQSQDSRRGTLTADATRRRAATTSRLSKIDRYRNRAAKPRIQLVCGPSPDPAPDSTLVLKRPE